MSFAEKMRTKAQQKAARLVLAEGTEPRTIQAARIILDEKIAREVTLIGKEAEIRPLRSSWGLN